jgi:hypothetical protein
MNPINLGVKGSKVKVILAFYFIFILFPTSNFTGTMVLASRLALLILGSRTR